MKIVIEVDDEAMKRGMAKAMTKRGWPEGYFTTKDIETPFRYIDPQDFIDGITECTPDDISFLRKFD